MAAYRCPTCGTVVEIDKVKKAKVIRWDGLKFPKHGDCELAKSIDTIDFTKQEAL